jgi:VanZ family protein
MYGFVETQETRRSRVAHPEVGVFAGSTPAKTRHAQRVDPQVEWVYVTAAVVASVGFLYASTIPLVFAVPNFEKRLSGTLTVSWNREGLLDLAVNVLAFVPLGFLWSAACSSLATGRRTRGALGPVVIGCLGLATLGEMLQFWIPLRTPSVSDILALECGAVIGYGLWNLAGPWTTACIGRCAHSLYKVGGPGLFHLRWHVLFAATFLACLIVNCYASPTQLFLLYRFRSTSLHEVAGILHDVSMQHRRGPLSELLPSTLAALMIVAACRAGQITARFLKARSCAPNRRSHQSMRSLTHSASPKPL